MSAYQRIIFLFASLACMPLSAQTPTESPAILTTGFIDLYACRNFNDPADRRNFPEGTGTTAQFARPFNLNVAAVEIQSTHSRLGFHATLGTGSALDVVHQGEPEAGFRRNLARFVYQASISYQANDRLALEGGIYPSHIGFEGFFSKDNWNYTRSWVGEFSPYYQTGVKATYTISPSLSAQVHLIRGWQLIVDNNGAPSVGTQLAWTGKRWNASVNTLIGPELPNDRHSLRRFADTNVQYSASRRLTLAASYDFGRQAFPAAVTSRWNGYAFYLRQLLSRNSAVTVRFDRFHDPHGVVGYIPGIHEVTGTFELRRHEVWKLEARYDHSDDGEFLNRHRPSNHQLLVLASVVYSFQAK